MRQKSARLGSRHVAITYPAALDRWFDGLIEPAGEDPVPHKWVGLSARATPDRFDVLTSAGPAATEVDLGEALATLWERVSFFLVDELRDAMALHAAVLRHEDRFVLLPGRTGAGKTRLSLWYRRQDFDLDSDEIATVSSGPQGKPTLSGSLTRPVIVKDALEASDLLRPGELPVAQQQASCGLLLSLRGGAAPAPSAIGRGFIVFPRFTRGAPFKMTALTPGETCLGLMDGCLNARNLARGGLTYASALARHMPAVSLEYGDLTQLDGTLDVLTRQILAAPPARDDMAALCEAFNASAALRAVAVPKSGVAPASEEAPKRVTPPATAARFPRRLTIGMATYDDFDGAYFTIQSIRLNNPSLAGALEFVVVDNHPDGPCSEALSHLGKSIDGYRYLPSGEWHGTAIRNAVFAEASSPFVLCIDSHVLIVPDALSTLLSYLESNSDNRDLVQGPLVYDDMRAKSTHMEPTWRAGMYGTWANDPRGDDAAAPAFDITMQGLGLFACRRAAWPGFNPRFRGFGGEEGYIHEKIRQRGGRTLCLPALRWLHRFQRPAGVPYVNRWEDRMRNYFIGFTELGLDTADMEAHFAAHLGAETSARIFTEIKAEFGIAAADQPHPGMGPEGRGEALEAGPLRLVEPGSPTTTISRL